jgi:hypothetical protein
MFTALVVAILGLLAPASSASPVIHPQTRVAAIEKLAGQLVGPSETIVPGGSRPRAPSYDQSATGSSVAAEGGAVGDVPQIEISASRYPESAAHIEDAQAAGQPSELTINRAGAAANRAASLGGTDPIPGLDRDEYPPAMFSEGGEGASVRGINPSDNRGAGSSMGWQCRPYPDGTIVCIVVAP